MNLSKSSIVKVTIFKTILLLSTVANGQFSQDHWNQEIHENGITIETNRDPRSDYLAFRARVEIDAHIDDVENFLLDSEKFVDWFDGCESSEVIEKFDDGSKTIKQVINFPWPASDRVFYTKISKRKLTDTESVIELENSARKSENTDLVTGKLIEGRYLLKSIGTNRTYIEWSQLADPSGSLPSIVINNLVTDGPYKSLVAVRKILEDTPR